MIRLPRRARLAVVGGIALLLFALTFVYRFAAMGGSLGGFENDEFVTLSLAQQVVLGERPLRDFVEVAAPLSVELSVWALRAVGHTLFAEAVLTMGMLGLCAAILFLLAWRASGSILIALAVALVQVAMAPRFYNYPKLLAYGLAIPALWAYLARPTRVRLFLIALAGVVAFLLRLDHGAYVAAAALITVAAAHWPHPRKALTEVAVLGLMALLVVSPYLVTVQREMGVARYIRSFVATAQQAAGRTNFTRPSFSFDLWQPIVMRVRRPPEPPRINVRWAPATDARARAQREQSLGLQPREQLAPDVWNYALADWSSARLAAIVHDPLVADTQGIDRVLFTLNDPAFLRTPSRLERLLSAVRGIRVLPGVVRESNAAPFLYYLMALIPLAALAVVLWPRDASALPTPMGGAAIGVVAVLALLINWGFLRGNLPSRLADVSEVVGVLAAWLAATVLARRSRPARIAASVAVAIVLVLTSLSVQALEKVTSQVQQAGIGAGLRGVRARTRSVHGLLTASPPVAAWSRDDPGMERLAWYVHECTAPGDRVLTVSYAPELFFMAARGFAAGQIWIEPGFYTSVQDQQLMIARIEARRVPIAITDPEPAYTDDYVESFPLLDTYLQKEYRETGTIDFGRGFRYRVLVRRALTPSGTYTRLGLPCFSTAGAQPD